MGDMGLRPRTGMVFFKKRRKILGGYSVAIYGGLALFNKNGVWCGFHEEKIDCFVLIQSFAIGPRCTFFRSAMV